MPNIKTKKSYPKKADKKALKSYIQKRKELKDCPLCFSVYFNEVIVSI